MLLVFDQDGAQVQRPLSAFLLNRERKDGVVADSWIFTGSAFYTEEGKERYAADTTGSYIGVTPKGASVIQYGEKSGAPYQGEDLGMEVNESNVPASGTKVRLVFSLHAHEAQPGAIGQTTAEAKP